VPLAGSVTFKAPDGELGCVCPVAPVAVVSGAVVGCGVDACGCVGATAAGPPFVLPPPEVATSTATTVTTTSPTVARARIHICFYVRPANYGGELPELALSF